MRSAGARPTTEVITSSGETMGHGLAAKVEANRRMRGITALTTVSRR